MKIITKFIDAYLRLNPAESELFEQYCREFKQKEREQVKEFLTSWEIKGRAQGRVQGLVTGLGKLLRHRFGSDAESLLQQLPDEPRVELLEALMDAALTAPDLETLAGLLRRSTYVVPGDH